MVKEIEKGRLLFEGDEEQFYLFTVAHPVINEELGYTSFGIFSKLLNESGPKIFKEVAISIDGFKENETFKGLFTGVLNLTIYYSVVNQIDGRYIVVISRGEINKGRFIIYLEGIWKIIE